jgi:hypothetical protein
MTRFFAATHMDTNISSENMYFCLIFDYLFWSDNEQDLIKWLNECCEEWTLTGMVLSFVSETDRLAFMLRWQNS